MHHKAEASSHLHKMCIRDRTTISYIIRDHDRAKFEACKENMKKWAEIINKKYGEGTVTLELKDQYYNMREKIEPVMHIICLLYTSRCV